MAVCQMTCVYNGTLTVNGHAKLNVSLSRVFIDHITVTSLYHLIAYYETKPQTEKITDINIE